MGWPYHFLDLTPDEKNHRRELLGQYAFYSQLSVLIPILGYGIYRLCMWLFARKGAFDVAYSALRQVPGSTESTRQSKDVSFKVIARRWRSVQWWLNDEVAPNWGMRGRWIAAIVWTLWLLVLCVLQTGHGKLFHLNCVASSSRRCTPKLYNAQTKPNTFHLKVSGEVKPRQ